MRQDHDITCEPPDDPVFEADVRSTFARLGRKFDDETELLGAVSEALRKRYPGISIRSRDAIGSFAEGERSAWHVFRDSRRRRPEPPAS